MQEWHEECVSCACMCVWKCACAPQLSLMGMFLSPYRAKIHRYCSSLCLPPQHVRLPDPAYGWGPRPHVRWQQGPHPVPGPPWHQQGPTYCKTIPMLCLPQTLASQIGCYTVMKQAPLPQSYNSCPQGKMFCSIAPAAGILVSSHLVFAGVHFFWCRVIKTL